MDVLKAYISLLIRDQQTELVASYVGQLPAELATAQYAAFLETVDQTELRPRCLELAADAGKQTKMKRMQYHSKTANIKNERIRNACSVQVSMWLQ